MRCNTLNADKGKDYKDIYTVVWHELSHASHFSQAGEGLWGRYVNYIVTHGGYGDGTAEAKGKEICELGESWAYAHERYCSYKKFGCLDNSGQSQWFAPSINSLYYMFSNKILSPSDVYKSLTSKMNSVNDLCCKLDEINDSPIDVIFAYHGALSNQTIWKIRNNTSERLYVYLDREYCSVNSFIDEYSSIIIGGLPNLKSSFEQFYKNSFLNPESLTISAKGIIYKEIHNIVSTDLIRKFNNIECWTNYEEMINGKVYNVWEYKIEQSDVL